jgi:hypothetical protein
MYKTPCSLAENNWEKSILDYLQGLYKDRWIPSHDLMHHMRVWQNAKDLIEAFGSRLQTEDEYFFEKLIISSFFHDTGLLIDTGENHGKLSRKICEDFLQLYHEKILFDTFEMLEVIESHDKKSYQNDTDDSFTSLYNILSIADDFDAFGAIGAYRYMEIYLVRGIVPDLIPDNILKNAANRYANFVGVLNRIQIPYPKMNAKYNVLVNLFSLGSFKENPVLLVEWVNENIVKPRNYPDSYLQKINKNLVLNNRILTFICEYNKEVTR